MKFTCDTTPGPHPVGNEIRGTIEVPAWFYNLLTDEQKLDLAPLASDVPGLLRPCDH